MVVAEITKEQFRQIYQTIGVLPVSYTHLLACPEDNQRDVLLKKFCG